ncbi:MAG: PAS domain S-box protein, partial [Candidatus Competibacteraceae bacterium]|nr:PAS domain S-box protein [Candidatus Competibacteraceae bacterium]
MAAAPSPNPPAAERTVPDSLLADLVRCTPHPVLISDAQGVIVYRNGAAQQWLDRIRARDALALLPPHHRELVADTLARNEPREVEGVVEDHALLWTYAPGPGRVYLSARAITEQRRIESQLRISEARHRLLAEQSTDLISRHTPGDWKFLYASPAATTLLGYAPRELLGRSSYEFFHPEDARTYKQRSPSVVYEQGYYTNTYRFRRKDGEYTWLETTSRSLRDPVSGELLEILCVSRDVSRRIKSERATRRLARIVELTTDLVAFAEPDGHITYLNEAARHAFGIQRPENEAHDLWERFAPDARGLLMEQALPRAGAEGRWSGEALLQGREGMIPVSLVILAHRSAPHQVEYFSMIARDMSERRRVEEQRRRHQAEMAHAARLITLGEMASMLAHELNQPLAAIVNYARGTSRRLATDPTPALIQDGLERIAQQASRAGEIIKRLRGFVRKSEFKRAPLNLEEVLDEMVQFSLPEARRAQVEVMISPADDLPRVLGDRVQIEQVILNLLRNAIEACQHQDIRRVDLAARRLDPRQVEVRVSDSGHGLPPGDPQQLFEQFYTTKPKGLGLGLGISRSIVEAHGGQLWAETNPTGGACFA